MCFSLVIPPLSLRKVKVNLYDIRANTHNASSVTSPFTFPPL